MRRKWKSNWTFTWQVLSWGVLQVLRGCIYNALSPDASNIKPQKSEAPWKPKVRKSSSPRTLLVGLNAKSGFGVPTSCWVCRPRATIHPEPRNEAPNPKPRAQSVFLWVSLRGALLASGGCQEASRGAYRCLYEP